MGYNSNYNNGTNRDNTEHDIQIIEARHKTASERRKMNQNGNKKNKKDIYDIMDMIKEFYHKNRKPVLAGTLIVVILIVLIAVSIGGCNKNKKTGVSSAGKSEEASTSDVTGDTSETAAETETEPQLTIQPEAGDSEIAQLISGFYQAFIISGDINEVGKYIDSTNGIDTNRLSINKKYIESVSDFVCYKFDSEIVDDNYTIMIVTYKMKLHNYDELLPSIDILFLVNGEAGYKIHNLTVDDEFDKKKVEGDQNFQILAANVSEELNGLLAANADLNEVYNLYLNPDGSAARQ